MLVEGINRFWSKVAKAGADECWIWKGSRTTAGYGQISTGATKHNRPRRALATHVALAIDGRARPSPQHVAMHSCDNPRCVNPAHLQWGTHDENMTDMWSKGRAGPQRRAAILMDGAAQDLRFTRSGNVKLNSEIVKYIRRTDKSTGDLARELDVSWQAIDNIRKGKTWREEL